MLISAAVDILAYELGIFNLKIGKNLGVLALGMVPFTGTSYIRENNTDYERKYVDILTFIKLDEVILKFSEFGYQGLYFCDLFVFIDYFKHICNCY